MCWKWFLLPARLASCPRDELLKRAYQPCKVDKLSDRLNTSKGEGASIEEVGLGRTAQTLLGPPSTHTQSCAPLPPGRFVSGEK